MNLQTSWNWDKSSCIYIRFVKWSPKSIQLKWMIHN